MPEERSVRVRLKGDVSDFNRALIEASSATKTFSKDLDSADGRMAGLVQTGLALGPALVPISAAAIPAIAGLTNQLAFAAGAAGVTALAFQGVGKALDAVNKFSIDPTTANLEKMQQTLATLGPEGQDFVMFLQGARPELQKLQDAAQAGFFPGLESGLTDVMNLLPRFEHIVTTVSTAVGDLSSEAGANLDSPKWHEFFDFIDREARPTLIEAGRTIGNFAEAFANLWMAFAPVSADFSHSFLDLSRDFAKWTDGLDQTQGFQEFVDYITRNGPKAWETLGAVGNALLQIVEAAAPIGEASLPVIKALADSISALADSNLGPIIVGVVSLTAALGRLKAMKIAVGEGAIGGLLGSGALGGPIKAARELPGATRAWLNYDVAAGRAMGTTGRATPVFGKLASTAGKAGAGVAGLAFVMSDLDDKMGLSNTASLALAGSLLGPWGAAVGGGVGLAKDFAATNDDVSAAVDRANASIGNSGVSFDQQIANIDAAQKKIADFKKDVDNSGSLHASLGDAFKGVGNDISGFFGKSHTEENAAASKKLATARKEVVKASEDAKFAEAGLGSTMQNASGEIRRETLALLDNIKTKNDAADASENAFSAETNYRQALKDAQAQARTNSAGINGSSDAALKNRGALDQLATAWNRVADSGDASAKDMRKARANFISVAEGMGVSKKAAEELSRELFHIPSPHPKVVLEGIAGALDKLQSVKDRLLSLDGTTAQTFVQIKESHADGGMVGLTRPTGLIHGPGGPRDDLIDAKLSNKEFVVNAAATARYLPELYAMNAQRFASGGPVMTRMPSSSGASAAIAFGPLTASLKGARVAIDKDGLMSFVDGRVELVMAGDNNYRNSKKR